jgi:hypothetical protein
MSATDTRIHGAAQAGPRSRASGAIALLVCAAIAWAGAAEAQAGGFVCRSGRHLILEGQPYYVHGANQYALFYLDPSSVDEVLADAVSLGANAIRTHVGVLRWALEPRGVFPALPRRLR